jgi:hypothetical protein
MTNYKKDIKILNQLRDGEKRIAQSQIPFSNQQVEMLEARGLITTQQFTDGDQDLIITKSGITFTLDKRNHLIHTLLFNFYSLILTPLLTAVIGYLIGYFLPH